MVLAREGEGGYGESEIHGHEILVKQDKKVLEIYGTTLYSIVNNTTSYT